MDFRIEQNPADDLGTRVNSAFARERKTNQSVSIQKKKSINPGTAKAKKGERKKEALDQKINWSTSSEA